ncbi:type II toxin-antitoxin system Phd/YefM family antitoxin [Gracilimonas sediminicola]|uniref:Antitoxin n=2 Tax=Balneolaceae TaxID=1813606 RepID=A0A9X2L392_9BACT|nr:type II toxin-antitoxin system Phd/YefM family antitoxin [Gracilimonas sediminicola]MCP9291518.1 type II toxin-antitoxin system Phd/YefM family antitoxin [Gracilimonas sediminicola]
MKVYTYSQARQNLAQLLDEVKKDGEIRIKRRDGRTYVVKQLEEEKSPLDVEGVNTNFTRGELNDIVREGRQRYDLNK